MPQPWRRSTGLSYSRLRRERRVPSDESAGAFVMVPPGVLHTFANPSHQPTGKARIVFHHRMPLE